MQRRLSFRWSGRLARRPERSNASLESGDDAGPAPQADRLETNATAPPTARPILFSRMTLIITISRDHLPMPRPRSTGRLVQRDPTNATPRTLARILHHPA